MRRTLRGSHQPAQVRQRQGTGDRRPVLGAGRAAVSVNALGAVGGCHRAIFSRSSAAPSLSSCALTSRAAFVGRLTTSVTVTHGGERDVSGPRLRIGEEVQPLEPLPQAPSERALAAHVRP
jgi:hypothetical protein